MNETPFYDFPPDLSNRSNAHGIQLGMVPEGVRVLDLGCHSGLMGSFLKEKKGCEVVGADIDPVALKAAAKRLDRVYHCDLQSRGWSAVLAVKGEKDFDVILYGDVLEHTSDPASILQEAHRLLKPGGQIIVSLPNVANLRVRLGLLFGNFDYAESGILDRTHLRFFTRKTARALLEQAGYTVEECIAAGYRLPHRLISLFPGMLAVQFVLRGRSVQ